MRFCNSGDGSTQNVAAIHINHCDLLPGCKVGITGGPPGQFCTLLIGDGTGVVHQPPGASGDLCIAGGTCIGRYSKDAGAIHASGTFVTDVSDSVSGGAGFGIPGCGGAIQPGESWTFQYWHRMPMGMPATFSEALRVTFE